MKLEKEIHFDCPKCQRPMSGPEALQSTLVTCPDCDEQFFPVEKNIPKATPEQQAKMNQSLLQAQIILKTPIQKTANAFSCVAAALLILAPLSLIVSHTLAVGDGGGETNWSFGWLLLRGAFWFYLLAQIIHIRANTHK
jgi:hypothetical protein